MREILFRAKTHEGEWVDGYYVKQVDCCGGVHFIYHCAHDPDDSNARYYVIKETVGQFTGLTDKNGKEIFEGDIAIVGSIRYIVAFKGAEWKFSHIEGQPYCYPFFASHAKDCEVIGNIYDNPELLPV